MKKIVFAAVLALALAVTCVGCDQTASDTSKETTDESTLTVGGIIDAVGAESLDPAASWDGWMMSVYGVGESLFRLDEHMAPRPWLVSGYDNTDDTTWNFIIRDDVTFSNGKPVTAEAVKACFERTYAENARAEGILKIERMEADGQVLTIKTPEINPTILNDLCDPLLTVYDAEDDFTSELGPACTGPYIAESFEALSEVQLVKNENYWGGEPKIDQITLKVLKDSEAVNMAFQNGEIDMVARMPAASVPLFENHSEYTLDAMTSTRSHLLQYNLESEALKDINIRKAINMCIDREAFVNTVFSGYAVPTYGIFPEALIYGGTEELELPVDHYDPEGAKALVEASGYSVEQPLTLRFVTYSFNKELIQLADMLQYELSQIGIQLEIAAYDVIDDCMENGAYDIAALCIAVAPTGNAQYLINMLFMPDGNINYGKYSNEAVNALAKELEMTADNVQRTDLIRQISQHVLDDMPDVFVSSQQFIVAYNHRVSGFQNNPSEFYLISNTLSVK